MPHSSPLRKVKEVTDLLDGFRFEPTKPNISNHPINLRLIIDPTTDL